MFSALCPCKTSAFTLPVPAWQLTDDGCIVGLLAETELLQLLHQIFIHITNHQRFTLRTVRRSISQLRNVERKEKLFLFVSLCTDTEIPRFRFCTKTMLQCCYQQLPNECKIFISESVCGTIRAGEGFYLSHTTGYVRRPQRHKLEVYNSTWVNRWQVGVRISLSPAGTSSQIKKKRVCGWCYNSFGGRKKNVRLHKKTKERRDRASERRTPQVRFCCIFRTASTLVPLTTETGIRRGRT